MSRWLLLTQDFPPGFCGGIASWAEDLAVALSNRGETTEVFARRTGDTKPFDQAFATPVHRMWGRSWGRLQGTWARWAAASQLQQGDRIIAATWRIATGLLKPAQRRKVKLAVAFHGSDLTQLDDAPDALRSVVDQAQVLLPVSRFLASELVRLSVVASDDPRVRVLPMPIQPVESAQGGSGLVCVARPTPLKGIDRAVGLAEKLERTITLIGPESPRDDHVVPLGVCSRAETRAAMAQAAAVVLLPRLNADGRGAEGLGLALIEAAAMGTPTIGCRTGGVPEAVGPGLLLDDPDRPDLVAVRAFLDDHEAGARARAWALAHHGADRAVDTLLEALPCG